MFCVLVAPIVFTDGGRQRRRAFLSVICVFVSLLFLAQRTTAQSSGGPRFEGAKDVLQRAGLSQRGSPAAAKDSVSDGVVVVYNDHGSAETFAVTLARNGDRRAQHIILKLPDGKVWDGRGDHLPASGRRVLDFLQTQYMRGTEGLLDAPTRNASIRDDGVKEEDRVLTVRENDGATTRYLLDPSTLQLRRFEFNRAQPKDSTGGVADAVEAYAFSDFRNAGGGPASYRVAHFRNGIKQEELEITTIQQVEGARNLSIGRGPERQP